MFLKTIPIFIFAFQHASACFGGCGLGLGLMPGFGGFGGLGLGGFYPGMYGMGGYGAGLGCLGGCGGKSFKVINWNRRRV